MPESTAHLRPQARTAPTNGRLRYFAYGSNLCTRSMAARCPKARPSETALLFDWRMTFRGVADVEPRPGAIAHGALWEITRDCEASLDRYEGVAGGFYRKEYLTVEAESGPVVALVYVMNYDLVDNCSMPSTGYLSTIARGYADFGLEFAALEASLEQTRHRVMEEKGITEFTPHGPKRMGPLHMERTRRAPAQPPKRQRKAARKPLKAKATAVAPLGRPAAVTTRSGIVLGERSSMSPATRSLEDLERRDERRRSVRQRNAAALEILTGERIA